MNSGDRDRNKTPLELTWWLWNDGVCCCCYPIANRKQSAQRAIVQPTISPVVNTLLIIDRRDHEPAIIRNFLVFLSHLLLASRPVAAALKGQLGKSGPTPSKDARLLWRRQPRFLSLSDCPPRREFRCRIKRFQLAHNCCRLYTIRNIFFFFTSFLFAFNGHSLLPSAYLPGGQIDVCLQVRETRLKQSSSSSSWRKRSDYSLFNGPKTTSRGHYYNHAQLQFLLLLFS